MSPLLIFKLVLRDWRAGELRLLLVALLVAVGTVTTITMTVGRLEDAMTLESASFLGADRVISSRSSIPESFSSAAIQQGLTIAHTLLFPSMVISLKDENRTLLASVKAVEEPYPLRGILRVAEQPFEVGTPTKNVPEVGTVWLDSRLFSALNVRQGDDLQVGYAKLKVGKVLISEPDRGFSMTDMAPRLLMRFEDVPSTQIVQPGSRLDYRLLIAGPADDLSQLYETVKDDLSRQYRWEDIRRTERSIGRALDRAESFFLIGGSLAVLLAGVAIALSANRYAKRHFDHIGILKTLGATPNEVLWGCLGMLLMLGSVGVVAGLLVGTVVHVALVSYFSHLLPPELPGIQSRPFVMGAVTGLICLLTFALPPFVALRKISPLRVIRRDFQSSVASTSFAYSFAAVGGLALLIWYSGSFFLTFWLLLGIVIVSAGFSIVAILLLRSGRIVGMQAGSIWRLSLAGLQRRYKENTGQIVVFGLTIMLLLILHLVRTSLIQEWQEQLPQDTPNHVLLNVVSGQETGVAEFLDKYTTSSTLVPMYRGRIVEVNDERVREYQQRVDEFNRPGPRLSSTRELTWYREIPPDNVILEGEWWQPDTTEHLVSVERDYAANWGLKLGDSLRFSVAGKTLEATISSIRGVEWAERPQPNFFMVLSPPVMEGLSATYMSFFHIPDENKRYINDLIVQYPTITVLDVDSIIQQVQTIIGRATTAVEWVLFLVLGSGALVLIAAIQSSRDQRLREHALLRALGGSRRLISGSLTLEFALLGVMAGIVAVIGAELTVFFIETRIFELSYTIRPQIWVMGPVVGGVLIAFVGYLGTRKLVNQAPVRILRDV